MASSAETELRAALAHGISRERVQLPLAQALVLQNKAEALLKETDPGIISGHEAAVLHGLRARAHLMLGQSDQAEQEIGKALDIEPKSASSLLIMSQILQAKGKLAEAEQAVDQALAANPRARRCPSSEGLSLRQAQGDATQALAEINRALTLDASNVKALLGRAQIQAVVR